MPSYNNTIKYRLTTQEQEEHQAEMHSRPAPRSGWRSSPRRERLKLRRAPFA